MSSTVKESGTTLLEVLCVLTILGVISMLGISYYSKAHLQTQTNDIVDNVLMRAATAEGSAHSKNILAGKNKTAHKYGIRTPETLCDRPMIQVGKIAADDQPLTPALCKSVVKRLLNQKGIRGIFSERCAQIDAGNFESSCETLTSLLVEVGSVPTRPSARPESAPSSPSTQSCTVVDNYDDCKADEFVNKEGCCEKCPQYHTRNDNNECVKCWDVKEGVECCNPDTGLRLPIEPCTVCVDGKLQPDLADPACATCPEGSTLVVDSEDGTFSPDCPKDHYVGVDEVGNTNGCCSPCPKGTITNGPNAVGKEQCIATTAITGDCEKNKQIKDINGNCYPCAWVRYLKVEDPNKVSQQCAEWEDATRMAEDGLSVLVCPKDKPLRDKAGKCLRCDTHEQVDVAGKEEYCSVCNGTNETSHHLRVLSRKLNSSEVRKRNATGEGSYCNFKCPEDKPLLADGQCYSCNAPEQSLKVSFDCEAICDGRDEGAHRKRVRPEPDSDYCAKLCPENKPLMNYYGKCYSCDAEESVYMDDRTDCEDVCDGSNQTSRKKRMTWGYNNCVLPCPESKPLQNHWGECYSCDDDPTDMRIAYMWKEKAEASCGVCDGSNNTSHKKRQLVKGQFCMSVCPKERPLLGVPDSWTSDGDYCFSCDTTRGVKLERKEECTQLCSNRVLNDNNYCVLDACPAETPLRGTDGKCYACDAEIPVIKLTTESDCEKCPNRHLNGGRYCALHCPEDRPLAGIISRDADTITNYDHCKRCDDSAEKLSIPLNNCETVCDGSDTTIHKKRRSLDKRYCMACPSHKPIIAGNAGDECHSCDEEELIKCVHSWNTCSDLVQCDGTNDTTRAKRMFGKSTHDAAGQYWNSDWSYSCLNRPLTDEQGYCQPCDFAAAVSDLDGRTLALCPGQRYISGNYSYACKGADLGPSGLGNNEFQCKACGGTLDKENKQCKI